MAAVNVQAENKRARLESLMMYLVSQHPQGVALDQLKKELTSDVRERGGGRVRREPAYEGNDDAVRQMLHRDIKDLRAAGIEVILSGTNNDLYSIDSSRIWITPFDVTDDEETLLQAVRSAIGLPIGNDSLFSSSLDRHVELRPLTMYRTILLQACNQRRVVKFGYLAPDKKKEVIRALVPLHLHVEGGWDYVVGYDPKKEDLRAFRLSRMTTQPEFLLPADPDRASEVAWSAAASELISEARKWRPKYVEEDLEFSFRVASEVAERIALDVPNVSIKPHKGDQVTISVPFDSLSAARAFFFRWFRDLDKVLDEGFRRELGKWLVGVNQEFDEPKEPLTFSETSEATVSDLALCISMIGRVLGAGEPVRQFDLAREYGITPERVHAILGSVIYFEYPDRQMYFPTPIELEIDPDDDGDGDPVNPFYVAKSAAPGTLSEAMSGITFQELFDIQNYLHWLATSTNNQIARSLSEKLEAASHAIVRVATMPSPFAQALTDAINEGQVVALRYRSQAETKVRERDVVPTSVQRAADGQTYFRAYSVKDKTHKTYLADRVWSIRDPRPLATAGIVVPADPDPQWLAHLQQEGRPVRLRVNTQALGLFELLPSFRRADQRVEDDAVIEISVANDAFLEQMLLIAGPGASLLGDTAEPRTGLQAAEALRTLFKLN